MRPERQSWPKREKNEGNPPGDRRTALDASPNKSVDARGAPYVSFMEAIPQLKTLLSQLWKLAPYRTIIMLCGNVTKSLLPAIDLRVRAELIDIINKIIRRDVEYQGATIARLLVIQLFSLILKNLLENALNKNQTQVNTQLTLILKRRLLDAHLRLDSAALLLPENQQILSDALAMSNPNYLGSLVHVCFNLINSLTDISARMVTTTQTISFTALPYFILYSIVPLMKVAHFRLRTLNKVLEATDTDIIRKADISSIAFDAKARREVSLFNLQDFIAVEYSDVDMRIAAGESRGYRPPQAAARALDIVSAFSHPAIYAFLAWRSQTTKISLADLHLIENSTTSLITTVDRAIHTQQATSNVLAHLINYYKALELRPALTIPRNPLKYKSILQEGMRIEFRDVSFRYSYDGPLVLDQVSFVINPGSITALVGYNGSGKSTIISLLARIQDPSSGTILINGHDLRLYDPQDIWKHMSFTHQDFARWPLTGLENVSVGNIQETSLEKLRKAAEATGALKVLDSRRSRQRDVFLSDTEKSVSQESRRVWDERLSKMTSEMQDTTSAIAQNMTRRGRGRLMNQNSGVELSGGEWQKIALARSFLRESADLLVLDEPSANLDPRAEHELFTNLIEFRSGRTTLFITHRLGVVRASDHIIFLDKGRVAEQGSHEKLMMHESGLYHNLVELQMAGFHK